MMKPANWLHFFLICSPIVLFTLTRPARALYGVDDVEWREGYEGHGTVHEQLGQSHAPAVMYSEYESNVKYSSDVMYSTMGLGPLYSVIGALFNKLFDGPHEGYLSLQNATDLVLGEKALQYDWSDLLAKNKLIIIFVFVILALIIINPFIAVCYFCFCCCRCKRGCPPCTATRDAHCRLWFSILLMLLILGLLIGLLIALLANKQINRAMPYVIHRRHSDNEDACAFLKDVSAHLNHLFVVNYAEMQHHEIEMATDAYKHLFLDLSDTSGGNALTELERILENMREASKIMSEVDPMEKRLRFFGSILRDGIRGAKRDIIRYFVIYCEFQDCFDFCKKCGVLDKDTSRCLHLDLVPNSTVFREAMNDAAIQKLYNIPILGIQRLSVIGDQLQEVMVPIVPPLQDKLEKGAYELRRQQSILLKLIEAAVNDIHTRSKQASKSFDDIYNTFGPDRNIFSVIVCTSILVIIILLIIAIIWGLCVRQNNIGSNALLAAIILMFCVFSFIMLVGLFYFIFGLITYQGVCRSDGMTSQGSLNGDSETNVLLGCGENETIIQLLKKRGLFDIDKIKSIRILEEYDGDDEVAWHDFKGDLTKVVLISDLEIVKLNTILDPLFPYESKLYTKLMCKQVIVPELRKFNYHMYVDALNLIYVEHGGGAIGTKLWAGTSSVATVFKDLKALYNIEKVFQDLVDRITARLLQVDKLILGGNLNFNETYNSLIKSILRSQDFIRTRGVQFINTVGKNLTESIADQIDFYLNMIVTESINNVGRCRTLNHIYGGGVDFSCRHLVNPINGFWVGCLLCGLLLIPVLFVAHRLLCLYKVDQVYGAPILYLVPDDNCPTCTGQPYKPPKIVICSGAQQAEPCPCGTKAVVSSSGKRKRE